MSKSKNAFRSLAALLLVAAMLMTLLACGKKPEPDASKPTLPGDISTDVSGDGSDVDDSSVAGDDTTTGSDVSDESTDGSEVSGDTTADVSDGSTTAGNTSSTGKTNGKTTGKTDGKTSGKTNGKTSGKTSGVVSPIVSQTTTKSTKATTQSMTKTTLDVNNEGTIFDKIPDSLSGQKIKVLVWWAISDTEKQHAAKFTDETGISVAIETIASDKYQTRLSSMIMSNTPPTCAAMTSNDYPQPITRGLLQPIKNTGWDFTEDIYATSMMDQFGYRGEHYGIALKGSTMSTFTIMFFNKDLLKQRGVTKDPYQLWKEGNWNWDTCLEIAQKCTDQSKGLYGLSITWHGYWMLSAGQDFVLSTKEGLYNNTKNPELMDAWTHAWRMKNDYKVIDPTGTNVEPFYAGTSALFAVGSYMMQTEYETYVPQTMKADWGVVPFPSPKGMDTVAGCEGQVWGFPARVTGDKLQAGAWYLRYWLDDAHHTDASFYATDECWEIMSWMWDQKIQSFNSMGVLGYGGEHDSASIQYMILQGSNAASIKSNLDSWYSVAETNIEKIMNEMPS